MVAPRPMLVWLFPDLRFAGTRRPLIAVARTRLPCEVLQAEAGALSTIASLHSGAKQMPEPKATDERKWRIDVKQEYELCAWARHFNASEQRVREAVQAVGDRADKVREHLARTDASPTTGAQRSERPR
jgi:hypothetical protein